MSNILVVFPTGSLSPKDRERLSKNGYCAVEAADPSKVCMILPGAPLYADDFAMSAIEALSGEGSSGERSRFARALFSRIKNREQTFTSTPPTT
jgi:hypothetical protein